MTRIHRIEDRLRAALQAQHLQVENDSHKHAVPPGSETHINALIVSPAFDGLRLVARQRLVYSALADELSSGLHALALRTLTPAEWAAQGGGVVETPPCHGGTGR
jgi:BolA protein